jgi:hypothetical protein
MPYGRCGLLAQGTTSDSLYLLHQLVTIAESKEAWRSNRMLEIRRIVNAEKKHETKRNQ